MKNKKIYLWLGICGVLLCTYLAVAGWYSVHYLPGTNFNGKEISGKTIDEVKRIIRDEASSYVLLINGRGDLSDEIKADEIDLEVVFDSTLDNMLGFENGLRWPVTLVFKNHVVSDSVAEYSEDKLNKRIKELSFLEKKNCIKPENAYLNFDDDATEYVVVPENPGQEVDNKKLVDALQNAIKTMRESIDLDEADVYVKPSIFSDDKELVKEKDALNKFVAAKITYSFGSNVEKVDGKVIKDWVSIEKGLPVLDESAVTGFIDSLARKYDTFGRKRTFKTSLGDEIKISKGDYGWWMDKKTTTKDLIEAIKSGKKEELEPVYFQKAVSFDGYDFGNTYVEVDLNNQHVYVYKNGELIVETDCVSGKATKDRITPEGIYSITYKERNATLRGANYASKVRYWMPFNGNVGLHDADWRGKFGSDIYVTSGSHGCINLPVSVAKKVFENVEKGEAVIVYGGVKPEQVKSYLKNRSKKKDEKNNGVDKANSSSSFSSTSPAEGQSQDNNTGNAASTVPQKAGSGASNQNDVNIGASVAPQPVPNSNGATNAVSN